MQNNQEKTTGVWIPLGETVPEFILKGTPTIGDKVKIEYDESSTPSKGVAYREASFSDKMTQTLDSPEHGLDFIFSGNI